MIVRWECFEATVHLVMVWSVECEMMMIWFLRNKIDITTSLIIHRKSISLRMASTSRARGPLLHTYITHQRDIICTPLSSHEIGAGGSSNDDPLGLVLLLLPVLPVVGGFVAGAALCPSCCRIWTRLTGPLRAAWPPPLPDCRRLDAPGCE